MRTNDVRKALRLSQNALPEMKARLALLDAAISALQSFQERGAEDGRETGGAGPRPFLVARRDEGRAEKAS